MFLHVVQFLFGIGAAYAIQGNYISNDLMNNFILSPDLSVRSISPVEEMENCKEYCAKNAECDAFSYSGFHRTCLLYSMVIGSRPIPSNTYKLYVREKTVDEGYYKFGTDYFKFLMKSYTADEGQAACGELGGELLTIKNEEHMLEIAKRLNEKSLFRVFIGINDKETEGEWKYSSGSAVGYTNWDWNGVWNREDLNCAIMKIDGAWHHANCENKYYVACTVPMF